MTDKEFSEAIVAMTRTLYRVCYAQLHNPNDREDAVHGGGVAFVVPVFLGR
jgi:DNA-directed RNA polymerase specialized sigma24 family protein